MSNIYNPVDVSDHRDFFNGSFIESFNALVTSNGTVVTMSLEQSGGGDLTMRFSDGKTMLDTTPAATIVLTAGSDSSPQSNYIYIPQATKVLTKSTSGFPTDAEHIKIGFFFVPSATHTQSEGAYINQNWNDHADDGDNQGHMVHMGERIRRQMAQYFSGIDPNGTDQAAATSYFHSVSGTEAYFKATAGVIYQMHRHTTPAVDSSQAGDDIHVVNWNGDAYHEVSDLTDIIADSIGGSLSNRYFNVFFFVVGNKTGEYAPMMAKVAGGSYNTQSSAENDVDGFDDLTMPREFSLESSTGVSICRMTLRYTAGVGSLSHISTVDLRDGGQTASGGASGGMTDFVDNQFTVFDESDVTKVATFQASGIATGTTREYTFPNKDGTIALLDDVPEGTAILSTGEGGGTKFLREDGDGTSSWQAVPEGVTDHGLLSGLSDDDHTQYSLVTGTRAFTGAVKIDGSADVNQLVIEGHSTQTVPHVIFQDSAAAEQARLGAVGSSVGFGLETLANDDGTDNKNVALGSQTLKASTTSTNNVGIGTQALTAMTTGNNNVAIGYRALLVMDTGFENVAIGKDAMDELSGFAFQNVGIGTSSLAGNDAGDPSPIRNTAIGYNSGSRNEGDNNVFIGYNAGDNTTTGSKNVVIGNDSQIPTLTGDSQLSIGNLIYGTGLDATNTTIASGNIGVGIKVPLGKLHVDQTSTTAALPVLYLDQADISEEMIEFNTTIGTGNAIEAVGAKSLTTTHFIKVTLPGGLTRYIPVGTIA